MGAVEAATQVQFHGDVNAATEVVLQHEQLTLMVWQHISVCPEVHRLLQLPENQGQPAVDATPVGVDLASRGETGFEMFMDTMVPNIFRTNKASRPAPPPALPIEFAAAAQGDVATVERILSQDTEAHGRVFNGMNLLVFASHIGQKDTVKLILHRRRHLLDEGEEALGVFDVEARQIGNRSTALHLAAWGGHVGCVRHLLAANGAVDGRMLSGDTALHQAAFNNHSEVVEALVAAKAAVNAVKEDGSNALHLAAGRGHLDMCRLLLESAAEGEQEAMLMARNVQQITPAHASVWARHPGVGEHLISQPGFDINAQTPDGDTVLHYACKFGFFEFVQKALEQEGIDVNARLRKRETPLIIGAGAGHGGITGALVAAKADVTLVDESESTALHHAVWNKHLEIVEILLEAKAPVDLAQNSGSSPLHYAGWFGLPEIASALIAAGAPLDSQTRDGDTCLHQAAFNNHTVVLRVLLEAKANVNAAKVDRNTSLHLAVIRGHADTIKLLLEHGADATVENQGGIKPIELASQIPNPQVQAGVIRALRGGDPGA